MNAPIAPRCVLGRLIPTPATSEAELFEDAPPCVA